MGPLFFRGLGNWKMAFSDTSPVLAKVAKPKRISKNIGGGGGSSISYIALHFLDGTATPESVKKSSGIPAIKGTQDRKLFLVWPFHHQNTMMLPLRIIIDLFHATKAQFLSPYQFKGILPCGQVCT